MSSSAAAPPAGSASLFSRGIGVLTSPRATFNDIVQQPRWLGMVLVTTAIVAGTMGLFLSTAVGRQALLDQRVDILESFGQTVDDARYAEMQGSLDTLVLQQLAATTVAVPALCLTVAALAYASLRGAATRFVQVLAVVAHTGALAIFRYVIVTPWNYLRESITSPLNLGVLFPGLDEGGFIASFLGTIDLFIVWWVVALAVGLSVLYDRPWRALATRIFLACGLLAAVVAGVRSALTIQ